MVVEGLGGWMLTAGFGKRNVGEGLSRTMNRVELVDEGLLTTRRKNTGKLEFEGQRLFSPISIIRGASRILKSHSTALSILQPCLTKTPCSKFFFCFCVLVLVEKSFIPVSAQGNDQYNFTVQGTSYDCDGTMICLGGAHVYTDPQVNQIQAGMLSLTYEDHSSTKADGGLAYHNQRVRFKDPTTGQSASFNTSFVIDQINGNLNGVPQKGDGMTFLISANNSATGTGGSEFFFFSNDGTSFNSVVVEFDTYQNPAPINDINDNHVSLDLHNITAVKAADAGTVGIDLNLNFTVYAWVEYNSSNQLFEVRISYQNSRPINPLLNYTVDLFNAVDEYMWVGFSSSNGGAVSNFYLGNWTFEAYGISFLPPSPPPGPSGGSKLGLEVGIPVGISTFLLVSICVIVFVVKGKSRHWWERFEDEDPTIQLEGMPERFSYRQLSVATQDFSDESKLGQGGFGSVYRGVIPSSGVKIAVKRIDGDSSQGEKEFMAEVSIINQLRHRNLIQLLGWCKNESKGKYILVYELMPNGSLDKVLFSSPGTESSCLSWSQRFNIVTGTAEALDYLHHSWRQQVIHRDVKSSNIMLDEEWNPKLGDFGLARLVDHQRAAATTLVAGTYGYIAPEAAISGRFTDKTDVYAFGAVLLEIACGRKAYLFKVPEEEMFLVDWVWEKFSQGDLLSTADERLGDYDAYWMEVVLMVGLLCSHPDPLARPSMRHVVQILAGDAPVPSIPTSKPDFVFKGYKYSTSSSEGERTSGSATFESELLDSRILSDSTQESAGITSSFDMSSNSV